MSRNRPARLAHIAGIGVDRMGSLADHTGGDLLRLENLDTDIAPVAEVLAITQASVVRDSANSYLPFVGHDRLRATAAANVSALSGVPIAYSVVTDEEMLESLLDAGVPHHYEEGMLTPGVGTSSAEDIVSYERGIRGGHFAVPSDHVFQLLGRQPTALRQVFEANAGLLRPP